MQQRIVAVFNKAVKTGKLKANPFYQLEKEDTISKPKSGHKLYLTPDELKLFMASEETNGVRKPSWHLASLALQDYASAT